MLTRLKVSGFKNLVGVDVRFGPFTCIAGANGIGKSNLFDAIRFLSLTANYPLLEAALRVRDESGHNIDVRGLFHRIGNQIYVHLLGRGLFALTAPALTSFAAAEPLRSSTP